jgi:hypothetical protein
MKFKILYTFFGLLFGAFLLISSSNGRATSAGEGNTGAPGENAPNGRTCQTCHNTSAAIQVSLNIELLDPNGEAVSSYIPGETYTAKVVISAAAGNPVAYGFQLVSLLDDGNAEYNAFQNPASNVKLATTNINRQYAEHNNPSSSNEFLVEWVAPDAGQGSVTFYAGGNGVNDNSATSGDGAAINSLTIEEGTNTFTQQIRQQELDLVAIPNPASDFIQLELGESVEDNFLLQIVTITGQVLRTQEVASSAGKTEVNISDLPAGQYVLLLQNDRYQAVERIVKW